MDFLDDTCEDSRRDIFNEGVVVAGDYEGVERHQRQDVKEGECRFGFAQKVGRFRAERGAVGRIESCDCAEGTRSICGSWLRHLGGFTGGIHW